MHIKTKETFPNMLRNCRFTFSHLLKNGVNVRFEPIPFDSAEWQTDTLPTELIRSVLSDGILFITYLMISSMKPDSVKAHALTKWRQFNVPLIF